MGYIIRAWTAHIIKCVNKFGSFHLHDIEAPPFSLSFQIYVDSDVVDISNQLVYDPLALLNGRGAIMSWLGDLQPIHRHIVVRSGEGVGFVAVSEKYPSMIRAIWEPCFCETRDAFASHDCTLVFGCICSVMRCNAPTHLLRALHLSLLLFQEIQYDSWKSGSVIHFPNYWFNSFAY